MANKYLSEAQKLAKSNIFDDAECLGEWGVFSVYQPFFDDDKPHYSGFAIIFGWKGAEKGRREEKWAKIAARFGGLGKMY